MMFVPTSRKVRFHPQGSGSGPHEAFPTGPSALARVLFTLLLFGLLPDASAAKDGEKVSFNRDIRPILSENCFFCHGPDKGHRQAELRLDVREAALEQEAMVPGKPEESELIARIESDAPDEIMPPRSSTKTLTSAQKSLLKRWIAQGAVYEPHWAYLAPKRPPVPGVKARERVRNPIDAFILAPLEARGIEPSPEADRRTLIRRLGLDLIGLPPSPEEVDRFVADTDEGAYERLVDHLLESPRYGERMAIPWLDLVRFTDTVGYHGDQNQRIFPYRDYVIDAFNANKPFDQFTIEQLAGDLLPAPTTEQLVATGFNRLNMMTREGGAQPKEYLAKYAADRVRTVAVTWLGSTLGCAECHDHKYDPFTTRDFYRLGAFFADVKQWGVYNDYGYTPNPELKGWTNDYPFPPEIAVESPWLKRRRDQLTARIDEIEAASVAELRGDPAAVRDLEAWTRSTARFLEEHPDGWQVARVHVDVPVEPQDDGSVVLSGTVRKGDAQQITYAPGPGWVASIRLEILPHASHQGMITRNGADTANLALSASVRTRGGKLRPLAFGFAEADLKEPVFDSGAEKVGVRGGWRTSRRHVRQRQTAVWRLARPLRIEEGDNTEIVVTLRNDAAGCIRLSVSPLINDDPYRIDISPVLIASVETTPDSRSADDEARLATACILGTGRNAAALAEIQALWNDVLACHDGRAFTMVTVRAEPLPSRVLPRGNWQDESGAVVEPGVPAFLPQAGLPSDRRLDRLDLARWLVSAQNPLTARVFVNRLWKQFFGTGISGVMEDVGAQGEWPTHPELLDWLAVEFRASGWNVKHMVKLMVMSSTYRQSSRQRPELHEIDPNNRLLAAQTPRRLEAEFVRDNALSIAGLIHHELGGPSIYPYQPSGYYVNLQFPDRDYVADVDERQYRRGVYMHWQRTFLHPMLANFDAPSREECTANRTVANTPQQALTLLNDPTFVEAARVLAGRLAIPATGAPGSDAERLDSLYQRALARPARPAEKASLLAFLDSDAPDVSRATRRRPQTAKSGQRPRHTHVDGGRDRRLSRPRPGPASAASLFNLHETITRY